MAWPGDWQSLVWIGMPLLILFLGPFYWFMSSNTKNYEIFIATGKWSYASRICFGQPKARKGKNTRNDMQ
jgi:hypothetical protein